MSNVPAMYVIILEKIRERSNGKNVPHKEIKKILGMVFKVNSKNRPHVLNDLQKLGLLKKTNQRVWEITTRIFSL